MRSVLEASRREGWGAGERGEKQSWAGEAGVGTSPAGGEALASLSHSLAARWEARSPVISPPPAD